MSIGLARILRGLLGVMLFAVLWEVLARTFAADSLFIAPLTVVLVELWTLIQDGTLIGHAVVSLQELVLGYLIAMILGITIGILAGTSTWIRDMTGPLVDALYATPLIALAPLIILSLGIGLASKIAVVALMAVFPILINTREGIQAVDWTYIETAEAFTANRIQTVWHVVVPASLPFLMVGLRLAVGRGIVGVVIAEFFGANAGLGFFVIQSSQIFDAPATIATLLVLAAVGVLANYGIQAIERTTAPWKYVAS